MVLESMYDLKKSITPLTLYSPYSGRYSVLELKNSQGYIFDYHELQVGAIIGIWEQ